MDGPDVFIDFCKRNNIGDLKYDSYEKKYKYYFSLKEILFMKSLNMIFDGNDGGLVLGNLHYKGGIQILSTSDNHNFQLICEMEGWEYLTSSHLNDSEIVEMQTLNDIHKEYDKNLLIESKIPHNCKIIDTRGVDLPVIIIDHYRRIIINRLSTKNYLNRIIQIDNKKDS